VSLDIQWIKGKTSPILKEVDRRAKAAARHPTNIDRGFRGGKVGRSKTLHRGNCYRVRFNSDPKRPFIENIVEKVIIAESDVDAEHNSRP
jgi:hypothetical protein